MFMSKYSSINTILLLEENTESRQQGLKNAFIHVAFTVCACFCACINCMYICICVLFSLPGWLAAMWPTSYCHPA